MGISKTKIPSHLNFAELKRRVRIASVIEITGMMPRFKQRGKRLIGPCPVHGGDNPSAFVVDLEKNLWHCFTGCNGGGDVVDFVRYLLGYDYRQTAVYLASIADTAPPAPRNCSTTSSTKPFKPFTYRFDLDASDPFLKKKGITPKTANHFDAGAYRRNGFLKDSVGVRLHDLNANPLGYAARHLTRELIERYGKWKFPRESKKTNFSTTIIVSNTTAKTAWSSPNAPGRSCAFFS